MPTGQERGEPTVEVVLDPTPKTATVTVRVHPKLLTPTARVHVNREGAPSSVVIEKIHESSDPELTVNRDSDGSPDTVTVKGICLARCLDEPGRMTSEAIEDHVLHMAEIAIRDRRELLRTTPDQAAKKLEESEAAAKKYRALVGKTGG
jgi:hypothetical protein